MTTGSKSLGSNNMSPLLMGAKMRGGHHHHGRGSGGGSGINNTNRVLTALIIVAFAFSLATVFFSSPSIARSFAALENNGIERRGGGGGGSRTTTDATPPPTPPPHAGPPRNSVSDLITWMLSGNDVDADTQHAALNRFDDSPAVPLEFPPGTLRMDHASALKHCHADPGVYGIHLKERGDGSSIRVSYSEGHDLAYVMLPKSGSSTARYMMNEHFAATERPMSLRRPGEEGGKMEVITFVRDPLSRFYSQYDESYVRTAPWKNGQNPHYVDPNTGVQAVPHPFPYLYENMTSYDDYEDVYCPINTRKSRRDCKQEETKEDGTLASRFEQFVRDYDGREPFDVHMTLQVPMLMSNDGVPLRVTQIYNTADSDGAWRRIAREFLGENATLLGGQEGGDGGGGGGVISGRSYPRRFNSDLVSVETQRRICELVLIDYCCLNLPLPDVCKGRHYRSPDGGDDGARRDLFCILDRKGRIQPGMFPEKSKS